MEDTLTKEQMFETVMKDAETFVNYNRMDSEIVAKLYLRWHRTLQQSFCRFLFGVIQYLAKYYEEKGMAGVSDARNESSVMWIKEIAKVNEQYFPFI